MTKPAFSVRASREERSRVRTRLLLSALFAGPLALAVAGCGGGAMRLPQLGLPGGPGTSAAYQPRNHVDTGAIPAAVRRVAILPLHTAAWRPGEVAGIEAAWRSELAQVERFELTFVSPAELESRFGRRAFASTDALPADLLPRLRADFGADAVLLLDLTHFAPYQPVALGLRAKLVTTADGTPLWAFDALFDAAQPEVSEAARRFATDRRRPGAAAEDVSGVLQSPSRFAKYVGHAAFGTIPPRHTE